MMDSSAPKYPTSHIPPKLSPEASRRPVAKRAEKSHWLPQPLAPSQKSLASPQRPSPPLVKLPNPSLQSSAFGIDVPVIETAALPNKLSKTQNTSSSQEKRIITTRQRAATILKMARESIRFGDIVSPETDSGASDEEDKNVMSGGLGGDDLSERERARKLSLKPRKSHFRGDLGDQNEALVNEPNTSKEGEESTIKKQHRSSLQSPRKRERQGISSLGSPEKPKKETVRLTRMHTRTARTIIGENEYVVDKESETEYYESVGPVAGCVVS